MSRIIKSSNSLLASFVAQLNLGSSRRLRYITVNYSKITINITKLLYKEGVIRLYILKDTKILIYFKYFKGCNLFKFKVVSKPGKRVYWSLRSLSLKYSKENFSGFYILSTPLGLITSNETLLYRHISGEILFKIFIQLMKLILHKNFKLNKDLDIFLNTNNNLFFVKSLIGLFFFYLPSSYFFKIEDKKISIIFHSRFFFKSFLAHFFTKYFNLTNLYIVRLKIKGLGYQIYRVTNKLYSFHFHYINFFYLFMPNDIITHWYKKRIILISNNLWLLKAVFKCILSLKKLGPYRLLGIRYPRQIILLKKGGKSKLK